MNTENNKRRPVISYIWGVTDPTGVWGGKEHSEKARRIFFVLGIIFTIVTAVLHFFVPAAGTVHAIFVALSIICWLENFGTFAVRHDIKEAGLVLLIILAIIFILT